MKNQRLSGLAPIIVLVSVLAVMLILAIGTTGSITGAVVSEDIGFIDTEVSPPEEPTNITNHTLEGNRNTNPIEKKPEQTPEELLINPENSFGAVHLFNQTINETTLPPNNTPKQLP